MDNGKMATTPKNLRMMIAGLLVMIAGFILMTGGGSLPFLRTGTKPFPVR